MFIFYSYTTDLVKTTISLRVGSQPQIYTSTLCVSVYRHYSPPLPGIVVYQSRNTKATVTYGMNIFDQNWIFSCLLVTLRQMTLLDFIVHYGIVDCMKLISTELSELCVKKEIPSQQWFPRGAFQLYTATTLTNKRSLDTRDFSCAVSGYNQVSYGFAVRVALAFGRRCASLRPTPKHPATRQKLLAPVVEALDSVIHRIIHYPANTYQDKQLRYPIDRDLSSE